MSAFKLADLKVYRIYALPEDAVVRVELYDGSIIEGTPDVLDILPSEDNPLGEDAIIINSSDGLYALGESEIKSFEQIK